MTFRRSVPCDANGAGGGVAAGDPDEPGDAETASNTSSAADATAAAGATAAGDARAAGDASAAGDVSGAGSVDRPSETDTVIAGVVLAEADPVSGAYVRLLDGDGEFAAEVVTSATGRFRLFAAPGAWTLQALSGRGDGQATITVGAGVHEVVVTVE